MKNEKGMMFSLLLTGALLMFTTDAQAVMYSFFRISNNADEDVASQLVADVTAVGSQVNFRFTNDVGIASSITDVYFDDGTLLGIASVAGSSGVSFTQLASPSDLPGGNAASPPFVTTAGFSADSDPPASANGVNSSTEFLDITFDLQSGGTFADVISDLADGSLRIGLHVQAIGAQGESDAYINNGNNRVVPAPGAALLGVLGLGVVGYLRRRLS